MKLLAQLEGILLDPVYTGKAMAGLIDGITQSALKDEGPIPFASTLAERRRCLPIILTSNTENDSMQESIQLVIDSAPFLLKGAVFTLQLSIGGMFFGLVLGFILALMRMSPVWPVKWLAARMYISIFRGTPLIAQLFMIYYGLPQFGIELDPIPAAMIGLSLNTAAYAAETLRAAIASIDKGAVGSGGQYRYDALADDASGHLPLCGAGRLCRRCRQQFLSAW